MSHYMHPNLYISIYIFFYDFSFVLNIVETSCGGPTDRQTDIITHRAAIAAQNTTATNSPSVSPK